MTKRTTDQWQTLLGPELPERIWVEKSDWDDEAWDVCVQHPDWGTRASIGSTHRKDVAHLFAAAPEAVAEVVRLRKALDELAHGAYVMANQHYYMGGERYDDLGSTEQSYYEALTRILEGGDDE